jgi:hypothetical protein
MMTHDMTPRMITARATLSLSRPKSDDPASTLRRFRIVAYTGVPIHVRLWDLPLVIDLEKLDIPSQTIPIRFNHDGNTGIGHTERIAIEDGQLIAEGVVSRATAEAQEFVASAENGFPWQASVGTTAETFRLIPENTRVQVNGREVAGPVYLVEKAMLREISVVDLAADSNSDVMLTAHAGPSFVAGGDVMSDATPTPQDHGNDPQVQDQPPVQVPEIQAQAIEPQAVEPARYQEDLERFKAIRAIFGQRTDLAEKAIREKWSLEQCQIEALRAERPRGPAILTTSEPPTTTGLLECAVLMAARYPDLEKTFDEGTLQAAERRYRGRIGLQELIIEAAMANGYRGRATRVDPEILRTAFQPPIAAGFSTVDISGILSSVTNKFLLQGFFSVERTWRNICAVRNVRDFKAVKSYRLIGRDQYELVGPGGELKHGTLGEEAFENRADTYGLMLTIDRRDIINDDLGAITTIPRKLGRGSGLAINDVFWKTFMNNASFFTAGRKNYAAGADTALGIEGLTKAEQMFLDMKDADGYPIGINPAILLVPSSLSTPANQIMKSTELRVTASDTTYGVSNPHAGKFRVEMSRYLNNTNYTGNSSKAWYLLADPNDLPVIEVAFLNGQESPTIETAEADFAVLGIRMRGYHDFGVALIDPKGGVKMKGEA